MTRPMNSIHNMLLTDLGPAGFVSNLAASQLYFKGPTNVVMGKIVAVIMTGAELGRPPMWSLKNIHFVKDKHSISSAGVADLVMGSGIVKYEVVENTNERCELRWLRKGKMQGTSVFTIGDARKAKLLKEGSAWMGYPDAMLFARALTKGARVYAADIVGGKVYTPEELRSVEVVSVTPASRQLEPPEPPDERKLALSALRSTVTGCEVEDTRVWTAVGRAAGKTAKDLTVEELIVLVAELQGYIEEGTLELWCDHHAEPIEGDVVEDDSDAEDARATEAKAQWEAANKLLHGAWGELCKARDLDPKNIVVWHDTVRQWSELEPTEDWSGVTVEAMDRMRKAIETGDVAVVGLATEWLEAAKARGVEISS